MEQREFLAVDATQTVANLRDVGLVLAIRAVFVLHLNHNDGTTVLDSEGFELFTHLLLENSHTFHKIRIALAQLDVLFLQEPPGQTAHFPLGTDVGTRTHDDVHAVLLSQTAEFGHVVVAREVELALLLFMDVPEDVDTHGIHAKRLTHLDTMLPVRPRNTGVMNFGSLYDERLAVKQESLVACGKSARLLCRHCRYCCKT